MKLCPKCGAQCDDASTTCNQCGTSFNAVSQIPVDPHDHTAEFDKKDISENKVVAMLCYLLGIVGIIIACLLSTGSDYVKFHVRACLKITVVEALLLFTLIIPFLGWIFCGVCTIICAVIRIISFFQICSGKAKDPAIISSFGFLK